MFKLQIINLRTYKTQLGCETAPESLKPQIFTFIKTFLLSTEKKNIKNEQYVCNSYVFTYNNCSS